MEMRGTADATGEGGAGRTILARACAGLVILLGAVAGCGLAEPPGRVTAGGESSSDGGGASGDGGDSSKAPPIQQAPVGTRCGEHEGWVVVVAQGSTDCRTANEIVSDYENTEDIAPGGRPGSPETVQGWACEPILYAKMGYEPDTYSSWCQKDGVALMTIDARAVLPAQGPIRKPTDVATEGGGAREVIWGFTSPSGSWYCGLVDNPQPEDGVPSGAYCYVIDSTGIPGTDVEQPGGRGTATAISIIDGGAAEAYYSGDWALNYIDGRTPLTLTYGEVLYARGGACTVDQAAGVTCTYGGHAFTVSTVHGYTAT